MLHRLHVLRENPNDFVTYSRILEADRLGILPPVVVVSRFIIDMPITEGSPSKSDIAYLNALFKLHHRIPPKKPVPEQGLRGSLIWCADSETLFGYWDLCRQLDAEEIYSLHRDLKKTKDFACRAPSLHADILCAAPQMEVLRDPTTVRLCPFNSNERAAFEQGIGSLQPSF